MSSISFLPEVEIFFRNEPQHMFIGGKWVLPIKGGFFETHDPGTGEVLTLVSAGDSSDINLAVEAARNAFKSSGWATMSAQERAAILNKLADLIDQNLEILVQIESLDVGKPAAHARAFDIPNVAQSFRYYADLSVQSHRKEPIAVKGFEAHTVRSPYGVCGFIIPWNFPFLLIGWNLAPALAAGNTVVLKPAEDTPLSSLYFARLAEQAGVPAGVINVVTGFGQTAGASLAQHTDINRMAFTGSPEVGRRIAASCGKNLVPCKLELGGKGAAVVFEDVNIDATAKALVDAVTLNAGQVCCTATRWMIHEKVWEAFVDKSRSYMQSVKIGHGQNPETQMGPLVSSKQKLRVLDYLKKGVEQGAKVLLEGGSFDVSGYPNGHFVKPALLSGKIDNICAREEIFGPVAFLIPFKDEMEASAAVNSSSYGLANSVWTKDLQRAQRVGEALVSGNSWINAHNLFAHGIPYAGCNLSGCGGGVLGPETYFDYLRPQSVVRAL